MADPSHATPSQQPPNQSAQHIPAPVTGEKTAEERIADYTLALTIFTAVLAAATLGLIWATYNLGERADKGMRVLERASVHPNIFGHNMDVVERISDPITSGFPEVTFNVVNYGKTPGFVISAAHRFTVDGEEVGDPQRPRFNAKDRVLGQGDAVRFKDTCVLTERGQRESIVAGDATLCFHVSVVYEDIWGDRWGAGLKATYDVNLKEFTLERQHTRLEKR